MKKTLNSIDLNTITSTTLSHYEENAESFWNGTKDHDVSQNYDAFLDALPAKSDLKLLDFGCGPGRDLAYFKSVGHIPVGLDGSARFWQMAQKNSDCEVLHQNFLELNLGSNRFDGIFANASLFHVPQQELLRVLKELSQALKPEGILFSSNPRGNSEGWSGKRFGNYIELDEYERLLNLANFQVLHHYYRPKNEPPERQPWLAVVSKKEK